MLYTPTRSCEAQGNAVSERRSALRGTSMQSFPSNQSLQSLHMTMNDNLFEASARSPQFSTPICSASVTSTNNSSSFTNNFSNGGGNGGLLLLDPLPISKSSSHHESSYSSPHVHNGNISDLSNASLATLPSSLPPILPRSHSRTSSVHSYSSPRSLADFTPPKLSPWLTPKLTRHSTGFVHAIELPRTAEELEVKYTNNVNGFNHVNANISNNSINDGCREPGIQFDSISDLSSNNDELSSSLSDRSQHVQHHFNVQIECRDALAFPKKCTLGIPRNPFLHLEEYQYRVSEGTKLAQQYTVVFGGIVRDNADDIPKVTEFITKTAQTFKDYRVVYFENDSEDNTVEVLRQLSADNMHVDYISQPQANPLAAGVHGWKHPSRFQRLATYRNTLLSHMLSIALSGSERRAEDISHTRTCTDVFDTQTIHTPSSRFVNMTTSFSERKHEQVNFDSGTYQNVPKSEGVNRENAVEDDLSCHGNQFAKQTSAFAQLLIIVDTDIGLGWDTDGVLTTISYMLDNGWDVGCANGVEQSGMMYDVIAYRDEEIDNTLYNVTQFNLPRYKQANADKPVALVSCFGGLAVYNVSALIEQQDATVNSTCGKKQQHGNVLTDVLNESTMSNARAHDSQKVQDPVSLNEVEQSNDVIDNIVLNIHPSSSNVRRKSPGEVSGRRIASRSRQGDVEKSTSNMNYYISNGDTEEEISDNADINIGSEMISTAPPIPTAKSIIFLDAKIRADKGDFNVEDTRILTSGGEQQLENIVYNSTVYVPPTNHRAASEGKSPNEVAAYELSCICRYDESTFDCEHISLHRCMRERGNGKIFLNPFMRVFYGVQWWNHSEKFLIFGLFGSCFLSLVFVSGLYIGRTQRSNCSSGLPSFFYNNSNSRDQ
eukprot:CFRG6436T1